MKAPLIKNNFFIITGGPGAGKSSVLDQLYKSGYEVVPEVARQIIKDQLALGGNAIHSGDQVAFRDLMLEYSIDDFNKHSDNQNITFFDRGIPELLGYSNLISQPPKSTLLAAMKQYRYNSHVFLFPPWEEIYVHDVERKQDFEEAVVTYHFIKQAYIDSEYKLIEMPKTSILSRTQFIIAHINRICDKLNNAIR